MDELIQYFIVNKEINMSRGKTAAQVAHVATIIAVNEKGEEAFQDWFNSGSQKKIILQGKEKDLLKLIENGAYYIRDNGLTELDPNTLTVVGLKPMKRSVAQNHVKRMQLLRD